MRIGIFIPIYFREENVIKCLDSLLISNFNLLDVFLCLGINGASKKFKKEYLKPYFDAYNKNKFSSIHIFDGNKNFGKPLIINTMAKKYNKFDYLVSIDSDMIVKNPEWLNNFLEVFDKYKNKNIGALCANQLNNNCHFVQNSPGVIKEKVTDELTIIYHPQNIGVAGGVLITPCAVWQEFGGYRASNLYGSDDGHYSYDCLNSNRIMPYVEEIKFIHPHDTDKQYSKWKVKAAKNNLQIYEINGFYENNREK